MQMLSPKVDQRSSFYERPADGKKIKIKNAVNYAYLQSLCSMMLGIVLDEEMESSVKVTCRFSLRYLEKTYWWKFGCGRTGHC